jgi:hypothetical protein
MNWVRSHGARWAALHHADKYDADWGVPTIAPLFDSCIEWEPSPQDVGSRAVGTRSA